MRLSAIRAHLVEGRLRVIADPLYRWVVACELAFLRAVDGIFPVRGEAGAAELDRLTAVVKTFERPAALRRLLASIRRLYPDLKVIVVDDSRTPTQLPGVETLVLPFDSGVSAGRRAGLARVQTEYVLNLDDDFVFYRHTGLAAALRWLAAHPSVDLVGGQVLHLPLFRRTDYRRAALPPTSAAPILPPGTLVGGLPVHDKVANFFLARAGRLRLVDWDPTLKRLDHADFFARARGVLTSVHHPHLRCLHVPTPFDAAYMACRLDVAGDAALLRERYGP
jgi:hypothetical protein